MRPTLSTTGGDRGKTSLFGGDKVSKASYRLHAYGTVDELNAVLGLILAERDVPEELKEQLHEVQKDLFCMGADLATPLNKSSERVVRIAESDTERIEQWGSVLEGDLPALQKFVLPSGCRAGALLHQARTICRRAERWLVHLAEEEPINDQSLIYLNRLSDYFFLVSRAVNKAAGTEEKEWLPE
ncbi:MAG: cob(I)yrinic acid a,c-diamide adenosyltransferase [Candidatus Peribacteraceae bacterium]|mgnify:CR=1 FL=1|jgi:cob(I)alamin adenosyltransferase|nr:ATP:cob(I)alamin adenosyltransferase [bacterium]MDP6562091.1 cob(I)yrinic acid a,c-diamide adenosyltransferase [Candidatus Peribacteraceae bacterium]|tara:strand:+ start:3576 stop:4130 length:555 start_codon:yes stop_codon:yes gene_type:complete